MAGKLLTAKQLSNMKVADLRQELRDRGLKVSGVKDELIDRLAKHLQSSKAASARADASSQAYVKQAKTAQAKLVASIASETPAQQRSEQPLQLSTVPELEAGLVPCEDALAPSAEAHLGDTSGSSNKVSDTDGVEKKVGERLEVPMPKSNGAEVQSLCAGSDVDKAATVVEKAASSTSKAAPEAVTEAPSLGAPRCESPSETMQEKSLMTAAADAEQRDIKTETTTIAAPLMQAAQGRDESAVAGERGQSTEHVRQTPRNRVVRRVMSTPLSPTALLAPEVTAPDGTTPVKSAQKTWRELCAHEAAGLRAESSSHNESPARDVPISSPDSESLPQATPETRSPSANRMRPASRSRSLPEGSPPAKRAKVVLRRRQSVLKKGSTTSLPNDGASPQSSAASACSPSQSRSLSRSPSPSSHSESPSLRSRSPISRSRSPILRRCPTPSSTKQQTPRNALFACTGVTPRRNTPNVAGAEESWTAVTPRELQARLRAEELRNELLKRKTMVTGTCVTKMDVTPQPQPSPSQCSHTPATFATPTMSLPSPAVGVVPQSPAESVAPSPRNLALIFKDASKEVDRDELVHGKQRMLEQLTQQMQKCLTKVHDQCLDDASREKYQTLASSIQAQLVKLSSIRRPAGSPLARGGC